MANRDSFDTLAPDFRIQIDGSDIPEKLRADVTAIRVLEDVEATGMASFTVNCWDGLEMKVKWLDGDLIKEGKEVVVFMGYRDHVDKIFSGEICGLEPEFNTTQAPVLTVRVYDRSHRLMKQRETKSYLRMKDSDIANQIASKANLSAQVEDTRVSLDYVLQHNQTNLEFLQHRAERIGYEVFVEEKKLHFRPRQTSGSEALTLKREVELLEFYPRSTTMNQVEEVTVRGWDPKQKKEWVAKAPAGDVQGKLGAKSGPETTQQAFGGTRTLGVRVPVSSQAEVNQLASGLLNEMALRHVTGEGVCIGRPDLRPGKLIKIEGIGRRFSGSYYVTSTEHSFTTTRGYRTAFTVRRNATG